MATGSNQVIEGPSIAPGVSVVVCCYNSEKMIRETLSYIGLQEMDSRFSIEVILVDNASSDTTVQVARSYWEENSDSTINLSFAREEKPGLSHARIRGCMEANYPYIIFCDDDNFLAANYCLKVFEILSGDLRIGACGGIGKPIFEMGNAPDWFRQLGITYAWGPQAESDGYVQSYSLYGAGLAVRRSILMRLMDKKYRPILTDRQGNALSSGGDEEITIWCKIMGYELYYSSQLKFAHYIKNSRLAKEYVLKLYSAIGASLGHMIPLQVVLFRQENDFRGTWAFQVLKWSWVGLKNIIKRRPSFLLWKMHLYVNLSRLSILLKGRQTYTNHLAYLSSFAAELRDR